MVCSLVSTQWCLGVFTLEVGWGEKLAEGGRGVEIPLEFGARPNRMFRSFPISNVVITHRLAGGFAARMSVFRQCFLCVDVPR